MSQTKLIMIDDTDPAISYTGNWIADVGSVDNLGNYGAPYRRTNHYTKGTGSFTYTFSGTYVGVFGTTVDSTNPNRQCTVDGTVIPNNQLGAAENGVMHCQINGLADTQHTLVVTVPTPNPSGYWFDYIFYIPSASVSEANAAITYLVGDPSFNYGSGWSSNGPGQATNTNGAAFTMQFTGRSLIWLGYYLSGNAFAPTTGTWSIDGGTPVPFSLNGAASQQTGAEFNQRFFSTGVLQGNQHTLKVVYNGNSGTTPLSIYQVLVQNGNTAGQDVGGVAPSSIPSAPANSASSSSSQGSTAAGSSPTVTGGSVGPTPTTGGSQSSTVVIGSGSGAITVTVGGGNSTVTQSYPTGIPPVSGSATGTSGGGSSSPSETGGASGTNHNGSNSADTTGSPGATGANGGGSHTGIIAGALGGVIALLLLFLLVFFLRRRKNRRQAVPTIEVPGPITHVVQPFTDLPSATIRSEAGATRSGAVSPTTEYSSSSSHFQPTPFAPGQLYSDEKRRPLDSSSHAQSPSMSTAFSSPSNERPESELIMTHQDSGVRIPLTQGGRTILEMPPSYSAE